MNEQTSKEATRQEQSSADEETMVSTVASTLVLLQWAGLPLEKALLLLQR